MKRLVSFRKLKIFSGLEFLKRSFKLFGNILGKFSKPVYENVFDCERYFACWAYGVCGGLLLGGVSG